MDKSSVISIKFIPDYSLPPNDNSIAINQSDSNSRLHMQANLINALRRQKGIVKLSSIKFPKLVSISNEMLDYKYPGFLLEFIYYN